MYISAAVCQAYWVYMIMRGSFILHQHSMLSIHAYGMPGLWEVIVPESKHAVYLCRKASVGVARARMDVTVAMAELSMQSCL